MKHPDPKEVASMSTGEMVEVLRSLRLRPVRRSELVARCGERLVNASGLGTERWAILEQVAVAGLDVGNEKLATQCIKILSGKFGADTKRVSRLRGMLLESKEKYTEALDLYAKILKEYPTDKLTAWRRVAVMKARGLYDEAAAAIKDQINKMHITAEEGYLELLNLALGGEKAEYGAAGNACEELILQDPSNYAWLLIYAEIQYCLAAQASPADKKSALTLSRKYYSESLLCNDAPNNTRAVWGLRQAALTLEPLLSTPADKKENSEILAWANTRLASTYKKFATPHGKYSQAVLE